MATQADMWADLRFRLGETSGTDTQVAKVDKMRYLNQGLAAMYPKIYRVVRDVTTVLVADTFEYEMPAALDGGRIIQIELETESGSGRYRRGVMHEILNHGTSPLIIFDHYDLPAEAGSKIRITAAMPLTPFTDSTNGADTYTGPTGTEELPVLYAMGAITAKPLDDRLNHTKYSTTHVLGNPQPVDLMTASQFWYAQFELMLDRWSQPFPVHNG